METLKELNNLTGEYIKLHWDNGGTSEFDKSINDISRMKIKAMDREQGGCFMYNINKWDKSYPSCVKYIGQKIYNFEFTIATPVYCQEIVDIINQRSKPNKDKYDLKRNIDQVTAIMDKVEELKGINLFWA